MKESTAIRCVGEIRSSADGDHLVSFQLYPIPSLEDAQRIKQLMMEAISEVMDKFGSENDYEVFEQRLPDAGPH